MFVRSKRSNSNKGGIWKIWPNGRCVVTLWLLLAVFHYLFVPETHHFVPQVLNKQWRRREVLLLVLPLQFATCPVSRILQLAMASSRKNKSKNNNPASGELCNGCTILYRSDSSSSGCIQDMFKSDSPGGEVRILRRELQIRQQRLVSNSNALTNRNAT